MPAPKFHTNPFRNDAASSPLKYERPEPDGSVTAVYEDGHEVRLTPDDGQHKARSTLYPGGDATERKIDQLTSQLHHRDGQGRAYKPPLPRHTHGT